MIKNKNKKAQSETVGFVFIVVIIVVIGIIFLGIYLRNKNAGVITIDADISNFISSSLSYTTDCYKDRDSDYQTIGDLVKYCYSKTGSITCPDGKDACFIINETYTEMLKTLKPAGTLSYYKMTFTYNDSVNERSFEEISSGNPKLCASKRAGDSFINTGIGNIRVLLEVCLSS